MMYGEQQLDRLAAEGITSDGAHARPHFRTRQAIADAAAGGALLHNDYGLLWAAVPDSANHAHPDIQAP